MRRAAKVDSNHAQVVETFRKLGCQVQSLASVGDGVPDLLVLCRAKLNLVEVKDGSKPPSGQKLTPAQEQWIAAWGSPVHVVTSVEDVVKLVQEWRSK